MIQSGVVTAMDGFVFTHKKGSIRVIRDGVELGFIKPYTEKDGRQCFVLCEDNSGTPMPYRSLEAVANALLKLNQTEALATKEQWLMREIILRSWKRMPAND